MKKNKNEIRLPIAIHPGDYLSEWLEENEMQSKELAKRTGKPEKEISHILTGKRNITPDMAQRLDLVTRVPAETWMKYQHAYDINYKRLSKRSLAEICYDTIGSALPLKEMITHGWFPHINLKDVEAISDAVLRFFGISDSSLFNVNYLDRLGCQFRQTASMRNRNIYAVLAWIRQGEIQAQSIQLTSSFSNKETKEAIGYLKEGMLNPDTAAKEMQVRCAKYGIKLVYVPSIKGVSTGGAAFIKSGVPIIILSGYGKRYDMFCFNFFHELGHILLHNKEKDKKETIFVDDATMETKDKNDMEREADEFANSVLIHNGEEIISNLKDNQGDIEINTLLKYADENQIHISVLIGRLQHEKVISYKQRQSVYKKYIPSINLFDD